MTSTDRLTLDLSLDRVWSFLRLGLRRGKPEASDDQRRAGQNNDQDYVIRACRSPEQRKS